jgi:hypothetical protein
MARLSIYVPDDLKAAIDKVGDKVNWSELVRPALWAGVKATQYRKAHDMTEAIERLRASKIEAVTEDRAEGQQDGRNWAENSATFTELRALTKLNDHSEAYERRDDGAMRMLMEALNPRGELSESEIFEECFGDRAEVDLTEDYVWAFIEGATGFFREVRHQL